MSDYNRVIPRDLFNESKLLKCIGKVTLLIHDELIQGLKFHHETNQNKGFTVSQTIAGDLFIDNFYFSDRKDHQVLFYTPLNAKDNWPLIMEYKMEIYYPFNESGQWQLSKKIFL